MQGTGRERAMEVLPVDECRRLLGTRQFGRIGQWAQPSLRRAMNCGPYVARAARPMISRHSSPAGAVSGSC